MVTKITATGLFFTVNGLRLHCLDWGNEAAPPLLCVHGFRSNAHAFDGLARHFRDRFHIVATDVRGRGESEWSKEGAYQYEDYVSDLEGIVDALGLQRFTLVGTSMGGRIAMIYAGRHPERLERLVINDIGPDNEAGSDRITREAAATPEDFASLEAVLAYRRQTVPALASLPQEEQTELALTLFRQDARGRWVFKSDPEFLRQRAANGAGGLPELWAVLGRLSCPTLLVWGTASDVLSQEQAQRVVKTLPAGQLVGIPGVGHAPNLTEPEFLAAARQFLQVD